METKLLPVLHAAEGLRRFLAVDSNSRELDIESLLKLMSESLATMLCPPPKSPADRNEIMSGRLAKYPRITILQDQANGVCKLSDELNLNELETFRYWLAASSGFCAEEIRQEKRSINNDEAAKRLFFLERSRYFDSFLEIVLLRCLPPSSRSHYKHELLIQFSNELLRDGLVKKLLVALQQRCLQAANAWEGESLVLKMSTCLFFICYSTQLLDQEVTSLVELVAELSNKLIESEHSTTTVQWQQMTVKVLALLQLSLSCALSQKTVFMDRQSKQAPFSRERIGNEVSFQVLSQSATPSKWRSNGCRGFLCLLLAVCRQTDVESGSCPPSHVQDLLRTAASLRGFTYVRLCLLPLLESCFDGELEHSLVFFVDAVKDLLGELALLFSVYRDFSTYLSAENIDALRLQTRTVDYLDDVLHLYAQFCYLLPSFPLFLANDGHVGKDNPYQFHPFLVHCSEISCRDPSLLLAMLRLFGAVGNDSIDNSRKEKFGSNCYAVHSYLHCNHYPHLPAQSMWHFFMTNCVDCFIEILSRTPSENRSFLTNVNDSATSMDLISDRDTDYLIAIADLIANVARSPEVSRDLLAFYHPIGRLFALLSCRVSIYLKGAILRALASLAYSSQECNSEIWAHLEFYQLVVVGPCKVCNDVKSLSGRKSPVSSRGMLRLELEGAESAAGAYPCTDGFLQLLDALLGHGNPDDLGLGYRVPGILPYVDFVIDDVLRLVSCRKYSPMGEEGIGQRFLLAARCIKVLSSVLRNYQVNALANNVPGYLRGLSAKESIANCEDALPGWAQRNKTLAELGADFEDQVASYLLLKEDSAVPSEDRRRKTKSAGYTVMAQLLCGRSQGVVREGESPSSLLEMITSVLRESSISQLNVSRAASSARSCQDAIAVLSVMQPPAKPPILFGLDEDLSKVRLGKHYSSATSTLCDAGYWREKAVTASVGLLYECSLREKVFLDFVQRSAKPPTFEKTERGRKLFASPVNSVGLADLLATTSDLSLISQFLDHGALSLTRAGSIPSVPVMVARILEEVACRQSQVAFLACVSSRDVSLQRIVASFAEGIRLAPFENPWDIPLSGINHSSSDLCQVYFFTPSWSTSLESQSSPCELINAALKCFEESDPALQDAIDAWRNDSVGEAIVHFLLTALSTSNCNIGHHLLGFAERNSLAFDGETTTDCFDAIVGILSNSEEAELEASSLLLSRPKLACLCYELIGNLVTNSNTYRLALSRLRKRSIEFLPKQLESMQLLCNFSDERLRHVLEDISGSRKTSKSLDATIEEIKAAIHSCAGWVLLTCAMEVRCLGDDCSSINSVTAILTSAMGLRSSGLFDTESPIISLLRSALSLPSDHFPEVGSSLIVKCLKEATLPVRFGKNQRISSLTVRPGIPFADCGFSVIDIPLFLRLLSEKQIPGLAAHKQATPADIRSGVQAAIAMNIYQDRVSAALHMCKAWGQLIEVMMLGPSMGLLIELSAATTKAPPGHHRSELANCIENITSLLVLPTLRMVSTYPSEMILSEKILQSMLTALTVLHRYSSRCNTNELSNSGRNLAVLSASPEMHQQLLIALLHSLLPGSTSESVKRSTSVFFRGVCYSMMGELLAVSGTTAPESYLEGAAVVLDRAVGQLTDSVIADICASTAPNVWRIAALSLLTCCLHVFCDHDHSAHNDGYSTTLWHLRNHRFLEYLVSVAFHPETMLTFLMPSMDLLVQVAQSREGLDDLATAGFFDHLANIKVFEFPIREAVSLDSPTWESNGELSQAFQEDCFLAVLNALVVMTSLADVPRLVTDGILHFSRRYRELVNHYLKLRGRSMQSLRICGRLLALLTAGAQSWCADETAGLPFDSILEDAVELFTQSICSTFRKIVSEPYPESNSNSSAWWNSISSRQPSNGDALETMYCTAPPGVKASVAAQWTCFDQAKFESGVEIICGCASFLRARCNSLAQVLSRFSQESLSSAGRRLLSSNAAVTRNPEALIALSGLFVVDLRCLLETFRSLLALFRLFAPADDSQASGGEEWLTTSQLVNPSSKPNGNLDLIATSEDSMPASRSCAADAFLQSAEDLIVAIHHLVNGAVLSGAPINLKDVELCADSSAFLPTHSFISQTVRWILQKVDQENV